MTSPHMTKRSFTHSDICDSTVHAAFVQGFGQKTGRDKAVHAVSVLLKTALIKKQFERVIVANDDRAATVSYLMTPEQAQALRDSAIAQASLQHAKAA